MKKSKPKATNIEKANRLFTVQGWILDGVADRLIVKQIIQQWGLGIRQAERYVEEAYKDWAKIKGVSIEMKRELKIAELQQRKRNLDPKIKNTAEGIRVLNEIDKIIIKLEGMETPQVLKLEIPEVSAVEFNVVYGNNKD